MEVLERYKDHILKIDKFVRCLDPAIRGEAFRFLLERAVSTRRDEVSLKAENSASEKLVDETHLAFTRISEDSRIPVERLMEIYAIHDSGAKLIDTSIPHDGPTDLLQKITLLCAYGNIIGRKLVKVELSTIYENLKELNAHTTSYSRDVKRADGVKVLADGVMVPPEGRDKARAMLRQVLKMSG